MTGVHHTAIVTTDVERALAFWRDGLGLTVLFDHVFTGDWPTLFDAKTDTLQSIFLGDPSPAGSPRARIDSRPGARVLSGLAEPGRRVDTWSTGRSGIRPRRTADCRARTARKAGSDGRHHG